MASNCYIHSALGAIAEFPELVQSMFLTTTKNDVGIYAVRFFIRGKPWVVTVDDDLFYSTPGGDPSLYFAKLGKNN